MGQAIDVLDCIDEALAWAEQPLQRASDFIDELPARAAARGLSTLALRTLVTACLSDADGFDPYTLADALGAGPGLAGDLLAMGATLEQIPTRARAAAKHVMRLALLVPGLARRARRAPCEPPDRAATRAWLAELPARAKSRAARARDRLGALPTHAELLRRRLDTVVVPSSRRSEHEITERLGPAPLV